MKWYDNLDTRQIYKGLGNVKFPNNGEINGTQFMSDFVNHHIKYHHDNEHDTFVQLGLMIQACLRHENFKTYQCRCQTNNIGIRTNRLTIVEHKLRELQDEINCIRNND